MPPWPLKSARSATLPGWHRTGPWSVFICIILLSEELIPFLSSIWPNSSQCSLCLYHRTGSLSPSLSLTSPYKQQQTEFDSKGYSASCNQCSQECGILKILHAAFPREKNTDPRDEFTQLIRVAYYCRVQHGNNLQKISNILKDTVHPVIKIKLPQEHVKFKKEIADMVFTLQISLTICITCLFYLLKPHCKKG